MTPLMYHAAQGNLEMVKWFGKYKKNRGVLDSNGSNALLHAGRRSGEAIIGFLLDLGEDPQVVNHLGDTLLIKACRMGEMGAIGGRPKQENHG